MRRAASATLSSGPTITASPPRVWITSLTFMAPSLVLGRRRIARPQEHESEPRSLARSVQVRPSRRAYAAFFSSFSALAPTPIGIFLVSFLASGVLGSTTVSTPLSNLASTFSVTTSRSSGIDRRKLP